MKSPSPYRLLEHGWCGEGEMGGMGGRDGRAWVAWNPHIFPVLQSPHKTHVTPTLPPTNPPAIALCLPFNPISHQRSDTISPLLYFTFRTERRTEGRKDEDRQRRRYRPTEKRLLPYYYSSQTEDIESVLLFLFTIEGFDAPTPRVT